MDVSQGFNPVLWALHMADEPAEYKFISTDIAAGRLSPPPDKYSVFNVSIELYDEDEVMDTVTVDQIDHDYPMDDSLSDPTSSLPNISSEDVLMEITQPEPVRAIHTASKAKGNFIYPFFALPDWVLGTKDAFSDNHSDTTTPRSSNQVAHAVGEMATSSVVISNKGILRDSSNSKKLGSNKKSSNLLDDALTGARQEQVERRPANLASQLLETDTTPLAPPLLFRIVGAPTERWNEVQISKLRAVAKYCPKDEASPAWTPPRLRGFEDDKPRRFVVDGIGFTIDPNNYLTWGLFDPSVPIPKQGRVKRFLCLLCVVARDKSWHHSIEASQLRKHWEIEEHAHPKECPRCKMKYTRDSSTFRHNCRQASGRGAPIEKPFPSPSFERCQVENFGECELLTEFNSTLEPTGKAMGNSEEDQQDDSDSDNLNETKVKKGKGHRARVTHTKR